MNFSVSIISFSANEIEFLRRGADAKGLVELNRGAGDLDTLAGYGDLCGDWRYWGGIIEEESGKDKLRVGIRSAMCGQLCCGMAIIVAVYDVERPQGAQFSCVTRQRSPVSVVIMITAMRDIPHGGALPDGGMCPTRMR